MSVYQENNHYIEEILSEIRVIENRKDVSEEQKASIEEAKTQLKKISSTKNPIQIWSHINLARALRALYLPEADLLGLAIAEQKRDKDFLDQKAQDNWQTELDDIVKRLRSSPHNKGIYECRQILLRYLQQTGRKWNSTNAREDLRLESWVRLSLLCCLAIVMALLTLQSTDALIAALFGGLGGLVSSMNAISEFPIQFRSRRLSIFAFFIRPLTGSIVAIMLLQFLVSKISPIQITPWVDSTRIAWIAAVSFAGGLSERFVLGKLGISE